tara:strand:- start:539 stop:787 length:249 start_codon:yes stop_codon:yes gene_type:complete
MQLEYIAKCENETYTFWCDGEYTTYKDGGVTPRDWVINHLDISKDWNITKTGNFKHANNNNTIWCCKCFNPINEPYGCYCDE